MLSLQEPKPLKKAAECSSQIQDCATLIEQVTAGDEATLAQLYETTSGLLFGLLLHILRDSQVAEDVLESVYSEFRQEAVRLEEKREESFIWLIKITYRQSIERLHLDRQIEVFETGNGSACPPPVHDSNPSISERQTIACTMLESLPSAQLEMLELAYYSGMEEAEIAAHLGQPVKIVRENLYLGMKNLLILLAPISF